MKKLAIFLIFISGLLMLQSFYFKKSPYTYENYELKHGEIVQFNNNPTLKISQHQGYSNRGSFDGTTFELAYDTNGRIQLSNVAGCLTGNQNELELIHCGGSLQRRNDTLLLSMHTNYNKFYIFNIIKDGLLDSFQSDVSIALISKTLKNDYCPTLLSIFGSIIEINAIPKGINPNKRYAKNHTDKTIGVFTLFEVTNADGSKKYYNPGDYVLVGGNSFAKSSLNEKHNKKSIK